jgi:hypothetical protein
MVWSSYSTESPSCYLVCLSILYPGLQTNILGPVKGKPSKSIYTFALHVPLDLDNVALCFPKARMLHLICCCLVKTHNLLPLDHDGVTLLNDIFNVHYHQMDGNVQAYDFLEMLIFSMRFSTFMMMITTWCYSLMSYMKSSFWCIPMEIYYA